MAYDFDTIAANYDRLNRVMTLGLDRRWRRKAVKGLNGNVLDVACGTGDMVIELAKRGCMVTGIDLSEEMLSIARHKCRDVPWHVSTDAAVETCHGTSLQVGDAEALPFADGTFDAVTCAFGVRNFVHLEQGLSEMLRVLKPGGTMVILELATPDSAWARPFYQFYTKHVIPWLGSRIAGNREAYTYLPESIKRFPKGEAFLNILRHSTTHIQHCHHRRLTFGVCRRYTITR